MKVNEIFEKRDGMTPQQAKEERNYLREELNSIIAEGGSYDDVEDALLDYGLEMDYLFELLC